jgi:hypothetical protein
MLKLMPIYDSIESSGMMMMRDGGRVKKVGGGRLSADEEKHDTVKTILQIGEIVIPLKVAKKNSFLGALKKFGYNRSTGKFR